MSRKQSLVAVAHRPPGALQLHAAHCALLTGLTPLLVVEA
jgi:hypothetical protein